MEILLLIPAFIIGAISVAWDWLSSPTEIYGWMHIVLILVLYNLGKLPQLNYSNTFELEKKVNNLEQSLKKKVDMSESKYQALLEREREWDRQCEEQKWEMYQKIQDDQEIKKVAQQMPIEPPEPMTTVERVMMWLFWAIGLGTLAAIIINTITKGA